MTIRQSMRTATLRKSISDCCALLKHGSAEYVETISDGVFALTVETSSGTSFTLREAMPLKGEEWTLPLARNYLLTLIRSQLMQALYGPPRVCVDAATGATLINNDASWEL